MTPRTPGIGRMMFSTCAVSCTPSAAVGSSMMISLDAKVAVLAIATHWRWPPDMWRMVLERFGIFTAVRINAASVALRMALRSRIEKGPRLNSTFSRPRNRLDGTSRSSARARFWNTVSMPASRASIGPAKFTSLPSNQILPSVRCSTPVIWRTKVDLPAPLSPMMATCSPLRSSKFASCSACTPP